MITKNYRRDYIEIDSGVMYNLDAGKISADKIACRRRRRWTGGWDPRVRWSVVSVIEADGGELGAVCFQSVHGERQREVEREKEGETRIISVLPLFRRPSAAIIDVFTKRNVIKYDFLTVTQFAFNFATFLFYFFHSLLFSLRLDPVLSTNFSTLLFRFILLHFSPLSLISWHDTSSCHVHSSSRKANH